MLRFIIFLILYTININSIHAAEFSNLTHSNAFFVGKENELRELKTSLEMNGKVVLYGAPGIGKSQVAKKFAFDNYESYKIIWRFNVEENMTDQLMSFAKTLYFYCPEESTRDLSLMTSDNVSLYVKNLLHNTNKSWLLIFENAEKGNHINDFLPEFKGNIKAQLSKHHIIITSRNPNEVGAKIKIRRFNLNEARLFLKPLIPNHTSEDLDFLIQKLDHHPLALAQSLAYIISTGTSIPQYVEQIHLKNDSILKIQNTFSTVNNSLDLDKNTLKQILELSLLESLKKSTHSKLILQIFIILDTRSIDVHLLRNILLKMELNETEIVAAISALQSYSLLDLDNKLSQDFYSMHSPILDYMKNDKLVSLNEHEYRKLCDGITNIFNKILVQPWEKMPVDVSNDLETIYMANKFALKVGQEEKDISPSLLKLMVVLLEYNNIVAYRSGDVRVYQVLTERIFNYLENPKNKEKIGENIISRYYVNAVYSDIFYSSKNMKAIYYELLTKAQNYYEKDLDTEKNTFLTLLALAQYHFFNGDLELSSNILEKYNNDIIIEQVHPNSKLQYLYIKSLVLYETGNFIETEKTAETFVNFAASSSHYFTYYLYAQNLLALATLENGNVDKASSIVRQALIDTKLIYESDDEDIIASLYMSLGRIDLKLINYRAALVSLNKADKILKTVYGGNDVDPSQALNQQLIGEAMFRINNYKKAYKHFTEAERIYYKFYNGKIKNIHNISKLILSLATLTSLSRDPSLTTKYLNILIQIYGIKHPSTQSAINQLYNSKRK